MKIDSDKGNIFKLVDLGNAYHLEDARRPGCTTPYVAPEHVIGQRNNSISSDVFAMGVVLLETYFQSPLLPTALLEAYAYQGTNQWMTERRNRAVLYHLVFLASIISGREAWAGKIVRQYYGNFSKHYIRTTILQYYSDADLQIFSALVCYQHLDLGAEG